ncbi:Vgr family protein, partial [Frigoriflavimonas asaccharolytica]
VMVGFVHNHPDRPFVMGGMFHGKVGLGGGASNRVKSIQTRSGHRIIFTEDESIIITDKSGNEIHLDTTGSNINITAPETMTLNCKNMNINVGENMTTNVGMNASEMIGMNNSQNIGMNSTQNIGAMKMTSVMGDASMFITGKLMEMIEGDVHSETKMERNEVSEGKVTVQTKENYEHHSDKEVKNSSAEKGNNY